MTCHVQRAGIMGLAKDTNITIIKVTEPIIRKPWKCFALPATPKQIPFGNAIGEIRKADLMGYYTSISWTDHTFNPWEGCTKVSPGCTNCYTEARNNRFGGGNWGKGKPRRRTSASNWKQPLRWQRIQEDGEGYPRPRVFCASLADWLDDEVPIAWLADLLKLIHDTPNLDWLLLTKRPENWRDRINGAGDVLGDKDGAIWPDTSENDLWWWVQNWLEGQAPKNVWVGTSVEDQKRADERIPELLKIPAQVRFLSCEPLLEKVDLWSARFASPSAGHVSAFDWGKGVNWVIIGGESGHGARLFDVDWARNLIEQCHAAEAAVFVKQLGANIMGREMDKWVTRVKDKKGGNWEEWPQELRVREFPHPQEVIA